RATRTPTTTPAPPRPTTPSPCGSCWSPDGHPPPRRCRDSVAPAQNQKRGERKNMGVTEEAGSFAEFQNEIYLKGLFGEQPPMPFDWREIRDQAYTVMTEQAIGYVEGAAGAEETASANRAAFDHWRLVPRMLRGIPAVRS